MSLRMGIQKFNSIYQQNKQKIYVRAWIFLNDLGELNNVAALDFQGQLGIVIPFENLKRWKMQKVRQLTLVHFHLVFNLSGLLYTQASYTLKYCNLAYDF